MGGNNVGDDRVQTLFNTTNELVGSVSDGDTKEEQGTEKRVDGVLESAEFSVNGSKKLGSQALSDSPDCHTNLFDSVNDIFKSCGELDNIRVLEASGLSIKASSSFGGDAVDLSGGSPESIDYFLNVGLDGVLGLDWGCTGSSVGGLEGPNSILCNSVNTKQLLEV